MSKDCGLFIIEDVYIAKEILDKILPIRYSKAMIFGMEMHSRGILCSETEVTTNSYLNPYNNLKNNCADTHSLSSWFKYRLKNTTIDNFKKDQFGFDETILQYGQFNYFFRICLPDEPLLHGLPMASAVFRKSTKDNYLQTVSICNNNESFVSSKRFVVLTNVVSTKLLIGARDATNLPIRIKKNFNKTLSDSTDRIYSKMPITDAKDLFLLDLQPQRKILKYDFRNKNYYTFERLNPEYS
jgi:hypothetical protein